MLLSILNLLLISIMFYAVYLLPSGEFSWCRIPSNITVFSAAYRYASRVAGSDKLVSIVTADVLQCANLLRPMLCDDRK